MQGRKAADIIRKFCVLNSSRRKKNIMYEVMLILLLLCCDALANTERTCSIVKLTTDYHVRQVRTPENNLVKSETAITLRCKRNNEFTWAYCKDGVWIYGDKNTCAIDTGEPLERHKRGWGRVRVSFRRVRNEFNRFSCSLFRCPNHSMRDKTPPEIRGCPSGQTVYALPLQRHEFVHWIQPVAWDNKDGQISVHLNGRKGPGSPFFELDDGRPTPVGYWAKDSSGNMATCNFNIYIKVKRCKVRPGFVQDGYRVCHLNSDMRLGTVCRYGCYQGHTLKGAPSVIKCLDAGGSQAIWSSDAEPYCEKNQCMPIVERGQLEFSCSENFLFRSICVFHCGDGYDIPTNQRRTKVCLASKTWDADDPDCIDIEKPRFEQCPGTLIFYPEDNEDIAYIHWDKPLVKDNKDSGLTAFQLSGPAPASQMGVNSYSIKYGASDRAGNEAVTCQFDVIVKQLRCPRMFPSPYMTLNCTGTRRGSECSFACIEHAKVVGKRNTVCRRDGDLPYAEWVMDFHPYCELSKSCPDLEPPEHGALSCDIWLGGRFCHPLCADGYSVHAPLPNLMICQDNREWTKKDQMSDCFSITNPRRHVTMSAEFYFSGDCNDPDTQMQIKEKYIEAIQNSNSFIVKKICQEPECNIGNVKVVCGTSNTKRSTNNLVIETHIHFLSTNKTLTSQQYESEVQMISRLMLSLENEFKTNNFTIDNDRDPFYFLDMTSTNLELDCPVNPVPVFNDIVTCIQCPMGTYYDGLFKTCSKCPKGSYQPFIEQGECILCPSMTTTSGIGATEFLECEDACLPGTWSKNGLPPCVECDIGYYESKYGSSGCRKCPGDTITLHERGDNVIDCVDFDIVFSTGLETSTVLQLENANLMYPFVILFYIKCSIANNGTFFRLASPSGYTIQMTSEYFSLNDRSFMLDLDKEKLTKKWYHIELHIDAESSYFVLDDVLRKTFDIRSNFTLTSNLNISLGGNMFAGIISQFMVLSDQDFESHKHTFKSCKSASRPTVIINWNDFAYSSLWNAYISIPSDCDDFDNCKPDPCLYGNCTDMIENYLCDCERGFNGKNCEINIDDCVAHACQNNASCVDEVLKYSCACNYGFTGKLCEIAMVDGGWSIWENWTECSVSCGNGTIQRKRACANPLPDNGGQYCNGSDTEVAECNIEPCQECEELVEPPNSTLSCETNDEMTRCQLKCHVGFDFDHDAQQRFHCGNETYYQWDFQTNNNPYGRLPYCIETTVAGAMYVHHAAFYNITDCNINSAEDVINKIQLTIKSVVQQLTCYSSNICSYTESEVFYCGKLRQKREIKQTIFGFNVTLMCNPDKLSTGTCFHGFEDAVEELETLESGDEFNLFHNNKIYKIIRNLSQSDAELDCPIGTVPSIAYCVPCSFGHYYLNNECLSCPMGTYQDEIGQITCNRCPDGWTTQGTDSISREDCKVEIQVEGKGEKAIGVVSLTVTIPVIIIMVVSILAYCRKTKFRKLNNQLLDPTLQDKDKIITVDNECFNDHYLETITLRVNAPPPLHRCLSDRSIVRQKTFEKVSRIECWTPEK